MSKDKETKVRSEEAMTYDEYLAATAARRRAEEQPSKEEKRAVYTDSKGNPLAYRHSGD